MNDPILLTVLAENSVTVGGLRAEHGLAWLLESGPHRILFDTGQTDLFASNADLLRCRLDNLDGIVLSHGHYDHTGGLAEARARSPQARVFLHPEATRPKYGVGPDGSARFIGMPDASRQSLDHSPERLVHTADSREIAGGIWVTGSVPRETGFEDVGGRFYLDPELRHPDPLVDDQAVFFPTAEGTVVVLGCAHAGVINTLRHVQRLTGGAPIRAVLGGMHLLQASETRLAATLTALAEFRIPLLVPGHCTGLPATVRLWQSAPGRCAGLSVGSRFSFER